MEAEERVWVNEAMSLCSSATPKGVLLMFIRRQDTNGAADIAITNALDATVITALSRQLKQPDGE